MIKAKELRIGNLVCDSDYIANPGEYDEIKVNIINGDDNTIDSLQTGTVSCDNLHGIPLTPEWLERFGFLQMEFKYNDGSITDAFIQKGRRYIVRQIEIQKGNPYYAMEYFPYQQSHNCIPSELRYVHQLQNLYFILTGEELAITSQ